MSLVRCVIKKLLVIHLVVEIEIQLRRDETQAKVNPIDNELQIAIIHSIIINHFAKVYIENANHVTSVT